MSAFKLSALTASLLVLTACGSGGGSDSDSQSSVVSSNVASSVSQSESASTTDSSSSSNETGAVSQNTETSTSSESVFTKGTTVSFDGRNTVEIDGVFYTLIPDNIHAGTYYIDKNRIVSDGRFDNLKYGFINTKDGAKAFMVGAITPENEIPATGIATYKGDYVHADINSKKLYEPAMDQAEFNVDFSNKTLTGQLNNAPVSGGTVALSAKIAGNGFEGTTNNVYTQGQFYGANASELSGVYQNKDEKYIGSYAAKKQ